jgi:hypothetical protein
MEIKNIKVFLVRDITVGVLLMVIGLFPMKYAYYMTGFTGFDWLILYACCIGAHELISYGTKMIMGVPHVEYDKC